MICILLLRIFRRRQRCFKLSGGVVRSTSINASLSVLMLFGSAVLIFDLENRKNNIFKLTEAEISYQFFITLTAAIQASRTTKYKNAPRKIPRCSLKYIYIFHRNDNPSYCRIVYFMRETHCYAKPLSLVARRYFTVMLFNNNTRERQADSRAFRR